LTIFEEGPEDTEFDFDAQLLNSTAYRAAWKKQHARNATATPELPPTPSSSKPTFRVPFTSRKSSTNSSSSWDQTSTLTPSEFTQESSRDSKKKKNRWSFAPLSRTLSENFLDSKKDQKQLQERLCTAAIKGDFALVQELIELGADPTEKRKKQEQHCLANAVEANSTDIVRFLLRKRADPNALDGKTGLACLGVFFTLHAANMDILVALLNSGALSIDVYQLGSNRGTGNILHFLPNLIDRNPEMDVATTAKLLLDHNCNVHEYSRIGGRKGYTPLQCAAMSFRAGASHGNEKLKVLIAAYIRRGADIHEPFGRAVDTSVSDIFLSLCITLEDNQDELQFLLDQGANANKINTQNDREMSALHLACNVGAVKTARVLIYAGSGVDAKDAEGSRPLHLAVKIANPELLSLLLDNGADPEAATTTSGSTPLHQACSESATPLTIIQSLVAVGVDVEARDGLAMAPLHLACSKTGRKEVVAYLLDLNVNIEAQGGTQNASPLHHAAQNNNDVALKLLILKGANLESIDPLAQTPLHYACIAGALDALRILLAKGAEVNAVSSTLDTPLHVAVISWTDKSSSEKAIRLNIIKALLQAGANPLAMNHKGEMPRETTLKTWWKLFEVESLFAEAEKAASLVDFTTTLIESPTTQSYYQPAERTPATQSYYQWPETAPTTQSYHQPAEVGQVSGTSDIAPAKGTDEPAPILTTSNVINYELDLHRQVSNPEIVTGEWQTEDAPLQFSNHHEVLDFMRSDPSFKSLKEAIQEDPEMFEPIVQEIGIANPQFGEAIAQYPEEFFRIMYELTYEECERLERVSVDSGEGFWCRFINASTGLRVPIRPRASPRSLHPIRKK
jgi:ankyrin repeat protein